MKTILLDSRNYAGVLSAISQNLELTPFDVFQQC